MTITLPNELTINQVKITYEEIAKAIEQGNEFEIDLGAINEIDAAGLQMLVCVKKFSADKNVSLNFSNTPDSVLSICETTGLNLQN